jgi:tetratricopeptide (TPR) repeat protein/O-antigen ligase
MRFRSIGRLAFIFLAIYLVFLGGSAYYDLVLPIRLFHHALITILLAAWLIGRIRKREGLAQTPLNLPIYAAVVVWVLSAAASIDPRMAFEHLWFQFIHILFCFVLVDLFARGRERLVMETQFMLAAAVIFLSGLELASWYLGLGIIPGTDVGWIDVIGPGAWLPLRAPRLSLAMNVSTLLAGYVAPLVVIVAVWALTTSRRDFRVVLLTMAAMLFGILVLTFSRGGILSLFTATGFLVVLHLGRHTGITRLISARVLYAAAALIGVAAAVVFVGLSLNESRSFGDAGRLDMWSSAARISGDHALLGVGPGLFGRAFRSYRDPALAQDKLASAHNAYLNTAAETGLAGVIVAIWLAFTLGRVWYQNWRNAPTTSARLRLEAALGALLGMGVHSLVDVFTITPIVLLTLLLAAYIVAGQTMRQVAPTRPWTAAVALVIVLAYGLWFFQIDQAQIRYQRSLRGKETALADVQAAAALDPGLNLYSLQIAYLLGQQAVADSGSDLDIAWNAYQHAVELEPTWDTGWINLAALAERQGDMAGAVDDLDRARRINELNTAPLHWARLAEETNGAPEGEIVAAYELALMYNGSLPLSTFWTATELRREALEHYMEALEVDAQYRILAVHDPERAYGLVRSEPDSAAEWWITGEYALSVNRDTANAIAAFSEAINRAPTVGDYYASRARAEISLDPAAAERDLKIAQLLGTAFEYPNAVRAALTRSEAEREHLLVNALPPRQVLQEFTAVLYGRSVAAFDVFPEMRRIGPGMAAMQPWYDIASHRLDLGDVEGATRVYRAILDYAPDEEEARERLLSLDD